MFTISLRIALLLMASVFLSNCQTDKSNKEVQPERSSNYQSTKAQDNNAGQLSLALSVYLGRTETNYLTALHNSFNAGLQKDLPNRSVSFAYEQNLKRIRIQVFDKETINHLFPFGDDDLRLSDIGDTKGLNIFSDQCGYVADSLGIIVRYACLSQNEGLLTYLTEQAAGSKLIINFVNEYRRNKSLTDGMKSTMVYSSDSDLDFSNPHHQLFYALFQLLVVEEMDARKQFLLKLSI